MRKISLCFRLPKSPLCLEFLSAEPTPGNGPRVAVIHNTPGHLNVGLKLNIQKTKIMASGSITSWQTDGETVTDFIFGGLQKPLQMVTAAMKLKDACSLEEKL